MTPEEHALLLAVARAVLNILEPTSGRTGYSELKAALAAIDGPK